MTSNDNMYIREDVFNARMDAFITEIRLENEKLRNELNSKIDGVQNSLNSKIDSVQVSLNSKIEGYQAQNERQFSEIRGEIMVLSTRMDNLDTRMSDLQNSISWSFTLATIFVAVIGIITSLFIAFAPSVWSFIKRKRQPSLSTDDVKSLVAQQVSEALKNYFADNPHT